MRNKPLSASDTKKPVAFYLSNSVWAELKRRSVLEDSDASAILNHLLAAYLTEELEIRLPARRHRADLLEMDVYKRRVAYLDSQVNQRIDSLAKEQAFSKSALAEVLLRRYLGLAD